VGFCFDHYLSVCLSVCLLAEYLKNFCVDFYEIWVEGGPRRSWWNFGSDLKRNPYIADTISLPVVQQCTRIDDDAEFPTRPLLLLSFFYPKLVLHLHCIADTMPISVWRGKSMHSTECSLTLLLFYYIVTLLFLKIYHLRHLNSGTETNSKTLPSLWNRKLSQPAVQ